MVWLVFLLRTASPHRFNGNHTAHFWSTTGRNGDGETSALLNDYMSSSQKSGFEPSMIIHYNPIMNRSLIKMTMLSWYLLIFTKFVGNFENRQALEIRKKKKIRSRRWSVAPGSCLRFPPGRFKFTALFGQCSLFSLEPPRNRLNVLPTGAYHG